MFSPKRRVKSNGRTVVGQISSLKKAGVQFESALEEGLIYILNFDSDVKIYHDQPVQIKFKDSGGKNRTYTPDYLAEYLNRRPALFEVKTGEYIKRNLAEHEEKVRAGEKFAKTKSWDFRVITDKEIRTEYCDNVRFLFRYQTYQVDISLTDEIIRALERSGGSTPNRLVKTISDDESQWPLYIASIWTLVSNKRICCDLSKKLHMEVPIWVTGSDGFNELKYPYKP